jgi:hypothetical protein
MDGRQHVADVDRGVELQSRDDQAGLAAARS